MEREKVVKRKRGKKLKKGEKQKLRNIKSLN